MGQVHQFTAEPDDEEQFAEAVRVVRDSGRVSASFIQRSLAIGYNRAARIVERMEAEGVVSPANNVGKRDILDQPALSSEKAHMEAADRRGHKKPPMKNTPEDQQVTERAYGVAAGELRQFIEQYEHMESEKKEAADRQKELMAEAKARGYDTKVMRKVMALRKRDKNDVAEEEAIFEMYKAALGMA